MPVLNDEPIDQNPTVPVKEHSDSSDEDFEANFVIAEITDMRVFRGKLEFCVRWQSDNDKTWEPLDSFPDELKNEHIVRYKNGNQEKYNRIISQIEKA